MVKSVKAAIAAVVVAASLLVGGIVGQAIKSPPPLPKNPLGAVTALVNYINKETKGADAQTACTSAATDCTLLSMANVSFQITGTTDVQSFVVTVSSSVLAAEAKAEPAAVDAAFSVMEKYSGTEFIESYYLTSALQDFEQGAGNFNDTETFNHVKLHLNFTANKTTGQPISLQVTFSYVS